MNNLQKLIQKSASKGCRLLMRFDPDEQGEQWGIKFYPEHDDDAHFFAFHDDIDVAARKLLDELQDFKW